MNVRLYSFCFLIAVLHSTKGFFKTVRAETTQRSENDIIKDCNGILYRLMVDSGEPPFPATACEIKQKVISCFERSQGSGRLLDEDRFLLLQSSIVDKTLMCPNLRYDKLEESIQNLASPDLRALNAKYSTAWESPSGFEKCAFDIHKTCEKEIFEDMVVNHLPWPKTTKWRQCYTEILMSTQCAAPILQKYADLQREFGEKLRAKEYSLGLFGIFMNDNHQPLNKLLIERN